MRPKNNVAAQNEVVRAEIVRLTLEFRNRTAGYPEALYGFLASQGIDVSRSVLVSATMAEEGIRPICGVLLTPNGHFMDFDLDCSADGTEVECVHRWTDETTGYNTNARNPGFGKGFGCIALEVLHSTDGAE